MSVLSEIGMGFLSKEVSDTDERYLLDLRQKALLSLSRKKSVLYSASGVKNTAEKRNSDDRGKSSSCERPAGRK